MLLVVDHVPIHAVGLPYFSNTCTGLISIWILSNQEVYFDLSDYQLSIFSILTDQSTFGCLAQRNKDYLHQPTQSGLG